MAEPVSLAPTKEETDTTALLAGLTTVVLWGSAFVAIRAAGASFSPGTIALGRLLVSSTVLTAIALHRRERLPPWQGLRPIIISGVLWLFLYSVSLNAAEQHVDAGTSAMLVNTGPLLIAIFAGLFLKEGFPRTLFLGCLVALAGCVLIGLGTTSGHSGGSRLGLGLLVVAVVAYASAVVVQKVALRTVSSFQVTWLGCVAATIACLPFSPTLVSETSKGGTRPLVWTAYLGLGPTAVGFATWSFALRRGTAGRVAALNYLIPVVAILLGWAYLHETPAAVAVLGGALCLAGVVVTRRNR
jgi:drug/metabolite transporter (DMT)-like permease